MKYNADAIERGALSGSVLSDQAGVETQSFAGFSQHELLHMSDGIEPILRAHPSDFTDYLLMERSIVRKDRSWLAWNLASAQAGNQP